MDEELLELINYAGIGPAGLGGDCTALDVHIEYSNGHEGVMAVGLVSQCSMAHRATVKILADGSLETSTFPDAWFTRPWQSYREVAK